MSIKRHRFYCHWVWLLLHLIILTGCKQIGLEGENSTSGTSSNSLKVVGVGPAVKACDVPVNRQLTVTFSDTVDPASLTANSTDSSCSGSFQVSGDQFHTCLKMSGSASAGNNNRSFVFQPTDPLDASTDYDIKITTDVRNVDNQALAAEHLSAGCFTSGQDQDQTAPGVEAVAPYSLYERIPLNTAFLIVFNEPMSVATLTTTRSGSSCSGSVQLSKDGFLSCVRMSGDPEPSANLKSFTITPAENLLANSSYHLKVTTAATDSSGNALAADHIITRGMNTGSELDTSAPVITHITPTNKVDQVSVLGPITVRFSERVNPVSIHANISGTACSHTIRVSTDDFKSCVRMTSDIEIINTGRSFAFYPASRMPVNTRYQIKVFDEAEDLAGNALEKTVYYASGFTTTQSPWDYSTFDTDLWVE